MQALTKKVLVLSAFAALAAVPSPAIAGRTLKEPKEIQTLPRKMNASQRDAALKAAKLDQECSRSRLKTREIQGLQCRLALYAAQAKGTAADSERNLQQLLDMARRAEATAKSVATYRPLTAKPGLKESKFKAHDLACNVIENVVSQLRTVPPTATPELVRAAKAAQTGAGDAYNVQRASCECMKGSASLAGDAGVSIETRGAIQGKLTSQGCLLDKGALNQSRGGPSGFSGNAAGVAAAASDEGLLLEYAKARDIGLNRCRSKYISSAQKVSRPKKLKSCACDEVKRWRFPKKRGRPDLEVAIPIQPGAAALKVTIGAAGKVKACGDITGPGL